MYFLKCEMVKNWSYSGGWQVRATMRSRLSEECINMVEACRPWITDSSMMILVIQAEWNDRMTDRSRDFKKPGCNFHRWRQRLIGAYHWDLRSWDQVTIHRRCFSFRQCFGECVVIFFAVCFYDSSRWKKSCTGYRVHKEARWWQTARALERSSNLSWKQCMLAVGSPRCFIVHFVIPSFTFQFSDFCILEVPCWFCL